MTNLEFLCLGMALADPNILKQLQALSTKHGALFEDKDAIILWKSLIEGSALDTLGKLTLGDISAKEPKQAVLAGLEFVVKHRRFRESLGRLAAASKLLTGNELLPWLKREVARMEAQQ